MSESFKKWPDPRILDLFDIELPILQAPMAGAQLSSLAIAVSEAGGLGALPCALLDAKAVGEEMHRIRQRTVRPVNVNFFCHEQPPVDAVKEEAWRSRLATYYQELGLSQAAIPAAATRRPFDEAACDQVVEHHPEVVSFHFGLPKKELLDRVRATGAKIIASATTVAEAKWLEEEGCDAIIAQGFEAGGHRGMFMTSDVFSQVGTFALVPQVVDGVRVPVVAAGGIADARGIVAALALGAAAVQIGTAYLFCPEATVSPLHLDKLKSTAADETALTNVFSGRPARGIVNRFVREVGPISQVAPAFPLAGPAVAPLRAESERRGSPDFMQMWCGQGAPLAREASAGDLTRALGHEAYELLQRMAEPKVVASRVEEDDEAAS